MEATNPITLYLTQFVIMFLLGWGAGHSIRIWTSVTIAIIGIFVLLPIIAILLLLGDGDGWQVVAAIATWLGSQLADGFKTIPIILGGTTLGILYGLGIRP